MDREQAEQPSRRHRARQVRTAIVALAQAYVEACRQHVEEVSAYVFHLHGEAPGIPLDEEQRTWQGMESRREALFAALGELGRGGEVGRGGAMTYRPLMPRLDLRRFRWHRSYRRDGTCFVRDGVVDQIVAEGLRQKMAQALCVALEEHARDRVMAMDPVEAEWVTAWLREHGTEGTHNDLG